MFRFFIVLIVGFLGNPAFAEAGSISIPPEKFIIQDSVNCKFDSQFASGVLSRSLESISQINPDFSQYLVDRAHRLKPLAIKCSIGDGANDTPLYIPESHTILTRKRHGQTLGCQSQGTLFHEYLHALGIDHDVHVGPETPLEEIVTDPVYACHLHAFNCLKSEIPSLSDKDHIFEAATRTCRSLTSEGISIIPEVQNNFVEEGISASN